MVDFRYDFRSTNQMVDFRLMNQNGGLYLGSSLGFSFGRPFLWWLHVDSQTNRRFALLPFAFCFHDFSRMTGDRAEPRF